MSANDYVDLTPKCKCGFAYNLPDATACRQCGAPYPPKGSKAARARAMARGELPAGGGQHEPRGGAGRTHLLVAAGAEHALTPGQVFTIGRSEDCSLSIPSKRVSRQHTEVSWRSGLPVLRNVSSTNQTKVNGRSIKEHELRDGDEIQIGPYEMTYREAAPGAGEPRPSPTTGARSWTRVRRWRGT
ncbi:MAG: FHA domain-containing protein [Planctomycetota bacterium]